MPSGRGTLLRTGGRFLEIGEHDVYAERKIDLLPFQHDISFASIDLSEKLAKIYSARPQLVHSALVGLPPVWRQVDDYLTGRKTIPEIVGYPFVRPLVSALAALC